MELNSIELSSMLINAAVCEKQFAVTAVRYILAHIGPTDTACLRKAVETRGADANDCVLVPKTTNGRVLINKTKLRLAVLATSIWVCPTIGKRAIQYTPQCIGKENATHVCGNPYHCLPCSKEMGNSCVVFGCGNMTSGERRRKGELSFFSLPDKHAEEERYRIFFYAAARGDLTDFRYHHRICSVHFRDTDIITRQNGSRALSLDAVPTFHCKTLSSVASPKRISPQKLTQPGALQFWNYIRSADFHVGRLGIQCSDWRMLPITSADQVAFARARLINDNDLSACSSCTDLVLLQKDLTYRVLIDHRPVESADLPDTLPMLADSESKLSELLTARFPSPRTATQSVMD